MLQIETYSVGQLQTNCYLVYDPQTDQALLLDPGQAADFLAEKVSEKKLRLKYIVASHGHFDHVLAAGILKAIFKAPFLINKKDEELLKKMNASATHWLKVESRYPVAEVDKNLKENQVLKLGDNLLTVMETPGHTPGGICLYGDNLLFSGDTLFKNGVGRTDFSYSDANQLQSSLERLSKLPLETICYPGHGSVTTIKKERVSLQ